MKFPVLYVEKSTVRSVVRFYKLASQVVFKATAAAGAALSASVRDGESGKWEIPLATVNKLAKSC